MGQKAEEGRINRFRKDMDLLKKNGYDNEQVAKLLKMDPGNLSSYYTGSKTPGRQFLDKFDAVLGGTIKQLRAEFPDDESKSNIVEEPMGRYLKEERDAHFQTLKLNNEAFRVNLSDMVSNNKKLFATAKSMADGVKSMASSTKSMAKSTETLAQTNQKIVDAHLSFLEEQRKK